MVFIIAEAGSNHNKKLLRAKKLIKTAVASKADAIKFQLYSSQTLYPKFTPNFSKYKRIPNLIKRIEFPRHWHQELKLLCEDNNIEFMSTPFAPEDVDELYNLGVKRLKIASFEAMDPRIVKYCAKTKLPLIISLGAGFRGHSLAMRDIMSWILDENSSPDITFLYCNSSYPTPIEDVDFALMEKYRCELKTFNVKKSSIGFSDHTMSTVVPAFSVLYGATVVEKHFTLDRKFFGPDHAFSLEPNELTEMVKNIRAAEITVSSRNKVQNLSPSEKEMITATRSVVAKRGICAGEKLTEENITTKRPFLKDSVPAHLFYKMINEEYYTLINIPEDGIISFTQIEKRDE